VQVCSNEADVKRALQAWSEYRTSGKQPIEQYQRSTPKKRTLATMWGKQDSKASNAAAGVEQESPAGVNAGSLAISSQIHERESKAGNHAAGEQGGSCAGITAGSLKEGDSQSHGHTVHARSSDDVVAMGQARLPLEASESMPKPAKASLCSLQRPADSLAELKCVSQSARDTAADASRLVSRPSQQSERGTDRSEMDLTSEAEPDKGSDAPETPHNSSPMKEKDTERAGKSRSAHCQPSSMRRSRCHAGLHNCCLPSNVTSGHLELSAHLSPRRRPSFLDLTCSYMQTRCQDRQCLCDAHEQSQAACSCSAAFQILHAT